MEKIYTILKERFSFPDKLLFANVATQSEIGPNIRTMRIYGMNEDGSLILITKTMANKWKELQENSLIALSIVSEDRSLQLICRGHVLLENGPSPQAEVYWELIRPDLRETYERMENSAIPPTFGLVTVRPYFWEILELKIPHKESIKMQWHLQSGRWVKNNNL